MSNPIHLALLILGWALHGMLHSLLASHVCKNAVRNRFPTAFRDYRLSYNLLATLLLIPPLWRLIGSRQEEKKLVACYGEQYRKYQTLVPGLVPRPWRYISRQQAEEMLGMEPPLN